MNDVNNNIIEVTHHFSSCLDDDDDDDLIVVSHELPTARGRSYVSNTVVRTKRDIKILRGNHRKIFVAWASKMRL